MENANKATWLSPDELAEIYNIKAGTIRKWLRNGKVQGQQVGGKLWRINRNVFDNFVESGSNCRGVIYD